MIQPQVFSDYDSLSGHAADWLVAQLREKPSALLCLAAGSSPARTYELLAERGAAEPALFALCRIIQLDEWGGLPINDPATCERQIRTTLIEPLRLSDRYVGFASQPTDPPAECARIRAWLARHGPIDVCILGLGRNGHLGFNEPNDSLEPRAHVAVLADSSLSHAMLQRGSQRPHYGLTLGVADLLQSRRVLLVVNGALKREPLSRLLNGKINTLFPASLLQLHPDVTLYCDRAAAGE